MSGASDKVLFPTDIRSSAPDVFFAFYPAMTQKFLSASHPRTALGATGKKTKDSDLRVLT
jgi:hypothetical protein